jgi:preprotein translocase subunit SecA
MKTALITDQHLEHREWLNTIDFYRDEIKIMQKRIEEVASKNTSKDVLVQVEHFQNQLIIQTSTLDQLSHDIRKHEQEISALAEANPVASDHRRAPVHAEHAEAMQTFEKMFNELRHENIRFLAKVM